jgi:hypothetical protein
LKRGSATSRPNGESTKEKSETMDQREDEDVKSDLQQAAMHHYHMNPIEESKERCQKFPQRQSVLPKRQVP